MRITIETGSKSKPTTTYQGDRSGASEPAAKDVGSTDTEASKEQRRRQIVAGIWTLAVVLVKARHFMKKRKR
jgi:hypothetical protein